MWTSAATALAPPNSDLRLDDGSRVAVIGGGPAGSLFAYLLLDMAGRIDMPLTVDVYEPRNFATPGPAGCNMCGGIVSETLVQNLAVEGVTLGSEVVQRGIESYVLHTDTGSVRIATPSHEARIGALHRGAGPRDAKTTTWESFDGHLQASPRGWRRSRARPTGGRGSRPRTGGRRRTTSSSSRPGSTRPSSRSSRISASGTNARRRRRRSSASTGSAAT